jgi:hypothetical protein
MKPISKRFLHAQFDIGSSCCPLAAHQLIEAGPFKRLRSGSNNGPFGGAFHSNLICPGPYAFRSRSLPQSSSLTTKSARQDGVVYGSGYQGMRIQEAGRVSAPSSTSPFPTTWQLTGVTDAWGWCRRSWSPHTWSSHLNKALWTFRGWWMSSGRAGDPKTWVSSAAAQAQTFFFFT